MNLKKLLIISAFLMLPLTACDDVHVTKKGNGEPIWPVNPGDDPVDPDPSDPTDPVDPSNPTDPVDPDPTDPEVDYTALQVMKDVALALFNDASEYYVDEDYEDSYYTVVSFDGDSSDSSLSEATEIVMEEMPTYLELYEDLAKDYWDQAETDPGYFASYMTPDSSVIVDLGSYYDSYYGLCVEVDVYGFGGEIDPDDPDPVDPDPDDPDPVDPDPTGKSDVLNNANTIKGDVTTYASWTYTGPSGAKYAGQSAGKNSTIQLRSKDSESGIVTTVSGGYISSIIVDWNDETVDDRALDIYVSNTAFTSPSDLYGGKVGTKIGSLAFGETSFTVSGNYAYVGVRSSNNALYLNSITFNWK